jgi:signal transduction histidine kinase/ActR/RegA family two-component response regulator
LSKLRETGALDSFEVERRRADGTTFRGALSSRLISYRGEEVIISSIYDLTDRLAMEEEMARQRDVLHQGEKMVALGELLASVAHELNNPLSVVVGQSTLLCETAQDPSVAVRAERIEASANRCARIVKAYLSMARQRPSKSVATDLTELLETALEVTGYGLRASSISVSSSMSPDLPLVWVDPDQLTQVFTNLIVNAEIALREKSGGRELKISSGYRRMSNEVVVKIKDNGPGIAKDVVGRIFEPFFTTKEVGEGTGIGLAICRRILSTHGGGIKHEKTPGGGATFVLRLPVDSELTETQPETSKPKARPGDPLKILVVDDEPDVVELISDILTLNGHSIETAKSGRVALSVLERRRFDVILSDIRMPDVDGPEFFAALTDAGSDMVARIAFITGDTLSKDVESFLASCGRPYIEKPITPNDVRELVAAVVAENMKR